MLTIVVFAHIMVETRLRLSQACQNGKSRFIPER